VDEVRRLPRTRFVMLSLASKPRMADLLFSRLCGWPAEYQPPGHRPPMPLPSA
jgi:hypothetical protein